MSCEIVWFFSMLFPFFFDFSDFPDAPPAQGRNRPFPFSIVFHARNITLSLSVAIRIAPLVAAGWTRAAHLLHSCIPDQNEANFILVLTFMKFDS
jgi:hypothetical protein